MQNCKENILEVTEKTIGKSKSYKRIEWNDAKCKNIIQIKNEACKELYKGI